jgi:phosphoribosylpyrophosphate synthetase
VPSAETGSTQIEAYEFLTRDGSSRIIVAWTNDNLSHAMSLTADQVVTVDMYGSQTTIDDGDDGKVDGYVKVTVGPSPVYLRLPRVST